MRFVPNWIPDSKLGRRLNLSQALFVRQPHSMRLSTMCTAKERFKRQKTSSRSATRS